jgi:hypothetical protein
MSKCYICKNRLQNPYNVVCDRCASANQYTRYIGILRVWDNNDTCEVAIKEQVPDSIESVISSQVEATTLGVSEKVTLTPSDIRHLKAGGLILVAINDTEYGLALCLEETQDNE